MTENSNGNTFMTLDQAVLSLGKPKANFKILYHPTRTARGGTPLVDHVHINSTTAYYNSNWKLYGGKPNFAKNEPKKVEQAKAAVADLGRKEALPVAPIGAEKVVEAAPKPVKKPRKPRAPKQAKA